MSSLPDLLRAMRRAKAPEQANPAPELPVQTNEVRTSTLELMAVLSIVALVSVLFAMMRG